MTEKNKQIVDLVEKGYSLNGISNEVGLSNRQIHSRLIALNRIGMNFERQFFCNGEVTYKLVKDLKSPKDYYGVDLYTEHNDLEFRTVVISDLHFGSEKQRLDALYEIYNYCITNNIHIILNAGDLIDGNFGYTGKIYEDVRKQIDFMIKKYPTDKNILNFILLGNHDLSSLRTLGVDLNDFLNNKRPDLISIGYSRGAINIKNEQIILKHFIPGVKYNTNDTGKIVFLGHDHQTPKFKASGIEFNYSIGSLSDFNGRCTLPPTAIDVSFIFYNGYFKDMCCKQLYYTDKKLVNFYEIQQYVGTGKPLLPIVTPKLEQEYPLTVEKKLVKKQKNLDLL